MAIVEQRRCACGQCDLSFIPKRPEQRFVNKSHASAARAEMVREQMRDQRPAMTHRYRMRRFGRVVAEMMGDDQRVTTSQLLKLCAVVWKSGYQAGYKRVVMQQRRVRRPIAELTVRT